MPVLINEFEAVAEAAPPPSGADEAPDAKPIKPHDLARTASRLARRKARTWAH